MLHLKYYAGIIIFFFILMSCQNDNQLKLPHSGYDYEVIATGDGQKVATGEMAFFEFDIYDDRDSLLQSYRDSNNPAVMKVVDDAEALAANPILDALGILSVGDSVVIYMPKDSIPTLPPEFDYIENLHYIIVVKEVMDAEAYQIYDTKRKAEQMEKLSALKARLPEVEELAVQTIKDYNRGSLSLSETENGVKYVIHQQGDGVIPQNGNVASYQYYGALVSDGSMFDNSFKRGVPHSFRVGGKEVIGGWDEAALHFPQGTTASLFIPAELGYGDRGSSPSIPPGAELYFYIEVEEVKY